MNSNATLPTILRFLVLVGLQIFALKQVGNAIGVYFNILIYPLFLLLLPIRSLTTVNILLGFVLGLIIDWSYGSVGVHASAGVFGGFIRNFCISFFAPKGGFSEKIPVASPHHITWQVFLSIAATYFALYLFWYFSVDVFTMVEYITIILKTVTAWILTMLMVWLYTFIANPKQ